MTEPVYKVEACRSCQAPVIWAVTAPKGASMPVDAEPVEDGNVVLRVGAYGRGAVATVFQPGAGLFPVADGPLRKSHFATCPQADEWRKG